MLTIRFHDHFLNLATQIDENTEQPIEVKILDFQSYDYESFAFDLIFFLLINARVEDLTTQFKTFIQYYHLEFQKTMQFINCPLDDYTYEKWVRMCNRVSKAN